MPGADGSGLFHFLRSPTKHVFFLYRRRYFRTHPYIRRTASAGSHRQALSVAVRPVQHFPVRRDRSHHQPAWKYDRTHRPTAKYHPAERAWAHFTNEMRPCPFHTVPSYSSDGFRKFLEHSVGQRYICSSSFCCQPQPSPVVMLHGRYGQGDIGQKLMRPIDFEPVINALVRPVNRFAGIEPLPISRLPRDP